MSLLSEFGELEALAKQAIKASVYELKGDLERATPVDTGRLKGAWSLNHIGDGFKLSNNMEYANFIFNGRRQMGNKTVGSLKLPDGVAPILQDFNNELQDTLQRIKK